MGDNSEEGMRRHQALVDDLMDVLDRHRKGAEKPCTGLHALHEAFTLCMARELQRPEQKRHAAEILGELALRTGYEAVGLSQRISEHGPEAARLHDGVRQVVIALVQALFRGANETAKCPGCTSAAVLTGLADGLMSVNLDPALVIRAVQERASTLQVAGKPMTPIEPVAVRVSLTDHSPANT